MIEGNNNNFSLSNEQQMRINFSAFISDKISLSKRYKKICSNISAETLEYFFMKIYKNGQESHFAKNTIEYIKNNRKDKIKRLIWLFNKSIRKIKSRTILNGMVLLYSKEEKIISIIRSPVQKEIFKSILKKNYNNDSYIEIDKTSIMFYDRYIFVLEYCLNLIIYIIKLFIKVNRYTSFFDSILLNKEDNWLQIKDYLTININSMHLKIIIKNLIKKKYVISEIWVSELNYFTETCVQNKSNKFNIVYFQHGIHSLGTMWVPAIDKAYLLSPVDKYFLKRVHPLKGKFKNIIVHINSKNNFLILNRKLALIALIYPTKEWTIEKMSFYFEEIINILNKNQIKILVKEHPRSNNTWWHKILNDNIDINLIDKEISFKGVIKRELPKYVFSFGSTALFDAAEYGCTSINLKNDNYDRALMPQNNLIIDYKSDEYYKLFI